MNLHHLKIFLAVAETGNFSRAAEILHISQPAVSVQVKKLEEELGIPLLEHMGKTVHLTHAGLFLRDNARHLFRQADEMEEQLAQFRGITTGTLRLGASTTPGAYLLPFHLPVFQARFPKVNLFLQLGNTRAIQADLLNNSVDLAVLGEDELPLPELITEKLVDDELVLIGAASHPLAGTAPVKWEDVITYPFVFREAGSNTREVFDHWVEEQGLLRPRGTELTSTEAIKRMVASGQALGVVSYMAVNWEISAGRLAPIPLTGFNLRRTFRLALHKDKKPTPLLLEFKRFLLETLAQT